jgi:hypothetical protein
MIRAPAVPERTSAAWVVTASAVLQVTFLTALDPHPPLTFPVPAVGSEPNSPRGPLLPAEESQDTPRSWSPAPASSEDSVKLAVAPGGSGCGSGAESAFHKGFLLHQSAFGRSAGARWEAGRQADWHCQLVCSCRLPLPRCACGMLLTSASPALPHSRATCPSCRKQHEQHPQC